jgi:hypothetical protein
MALPTYIWVFDLLFNTVFMLNCCHELVTSARDKARDRRTAEVFTRLNTVNAYTWDFYYSSFYYSSYDYKADFIIRTLVESHKYYGEDFGRKHAEEGYISKYHVELFTLLHKLRVRPRDV